MQFRQATIEDIKQMQVVRNLVKENVLSNPAYVTDADVQHYITKRGKGWVCEAGETIVGFAIADLMEHSIWALFVHPDYEGKGLGLHLHQLMMDWYFSQTATTVWLSTAPATRAETFYKKAGWQQTGLHDKGQIKFEMTANEWHHHREKLQLRNQ